jgi:hypothetical protein
MALVLLFDVSLFTPASPCLQLNKKPFYLPNSVGDAQPTIALLYHISPFFNRKRGIVFITPHPKGEREK